MRRPTLLAAGAVAVLVLSCTSDQPTAGPSATLSATSPASTLATPSPAPGTTSSTAPSSTPSRATDQSTSLSTPSPSPSGSLSTPSPLPTPTASVAPGRSRTPDPLTAGGAGPDGVAVTMPDDPTGAPTVVLLHGGAWVAGTPASMDDLAGVLADRGAVVVNLSYRTLLAGGGHPQTFDDVACGMSQARAIANAVDASGEVVVVGYSAGAHLGLVVSLDAAAWRDDCPFTEDATPDRFVGLAGSYDLDMVEFIMRALLGGTRAERPDVWDSVDPFALLEDGAPGVGAFPVELVAGDADVVAPLAISEAMRDALRRAEVEVTYEVLAGVDHLQFVRPDLVADLIIE